MPENVVDSNQKVELEKRRWLECAVEYAELVMGLEDAILKGCSEEEAIDLAKKNLGVKPFLQKFKQATNGQIQRRLEIIIPHFLERRKLVEEYKKLASDPEAIRKKFEREINSRNLQKPSIKLSRPKGCLYVPTAPYALGIIVSQEEMKRIASKVGASEFQGLHLGKGLVITMVEDDEIRRKQILPQAKRRIAYVLSHENYHALADVMGARGNRQRLAEAQKYLYDTPKGEPKEVTARDVNRTINCILRMAKGEIIPEVDMDITAYQPNVKTKDQFKVAFSSVFTQVWKPIKGNTLKLKSALENPPAWWKLSNQERLSLKTRVDELEKFIIDKIGTFLVASSKALSSRSRRLLFYAATFLRLEDFDLLLPAVELINQKNPQ